MPQLDLEIFFEQIAGFYVVFVVVLGYQVSHNIYNHTVAIKLRKFVVESSNKQALSLKTEKALITNMLEKSLLR